MTSASCASPCKIIILVIALVADAFSFSRDPDERPSASELQQHPYLILQPDWTFNGFK